jgi:vacuolar-type H+-ATPase subunit H
MVHFSGNENPDRSFFLIFHMQESGKIMKEIIEGILGEEQKARELLQQAKDEAKEKRIRTEEQMRQKLAETREKARKDAEELLLRARNEAQKEREEELSRSVQDVQSLLNSKKSRIQECVQKLFLMVLGEVSD